MIPGYLQNGQPPSRLRRGFPFQVPAGSRFGGHGMKALVRAT